MGPKYPATLLQCLLLQEDLPDYHSPGGRSPAFTLLTPPGGGRTITIIFTTVPKAHIYQSLTQELYLYYPILSSQSLHEAGSVLSPFTDEETETSMIEGKWLP